VDKNVIEQMGIGMAWAPVPMPDVHAYAHLLDTIFVHACND
jgi:hypothetical protein